jgi:hypothetical protein
LAVAAVVAQDMVQGVPAQVVQVVAATEVLLVVAQMEPPTLVVVVEVVWATPAILGVLMEQAGRVALVLLLLHIKPLLKKELVEH